MSELRPHDTDFRTAPAGRRRNFWIMLGIILVVCLSATGYQLYHYIQLRLSLVGDGKHVESYHYDLSNLSVPREPLVAGGMTKDGLTVPINPRLVDQKNINTFKDPGPRVVTSGIIDQFNGDMFKVFSRPVVGSDECIGVTVNGESRAYPIRFIRWHEIINDTLGGVPIAVTYSPLCDAAIVFDRRVDGQTLTFGYSGLLYNCNLVMYDKQKDPKDESLWIQLKFTAVSGKRAGTKLTVLPIEYTTWKVWEATHAQTTVFIGNYFLRDRYRNDPYLDYFREKKLRFDVKPMPPKDAAPYADFDDIYAVKTPSGWETIPADAVTFERGNVVLKRDIHFNKSATVGDLSAALDTKSDDVIPAGSPVVRCLWFAWYAMHPPGDTPYRIAH